MSLLIENEDKKAQKIGFMLAEYTDLTIKNFDNKRAYEVEQSRMDPARARLLKHLIKLSAGK